MNSLINHNPPVEPCTLAAKKVAANTNKDYLPIVLLHGWGSSSATWESIGSELNREHDLMYIDLPGFGGNASVPFTSLPALLGQIARLLPAQCFLIGWSLGGMIATRLAASYPEKIKKLVTLATNPSFVARESWPAAMPEITFQNFYDNFADDPGKTITRFCGLQAQGDQHRRQLLLQLKEQQSEINDTWQYTLRYLDELQNQNILPEIFQPCLHLFGENDALVPVTAATEVAARGAQHRVEILKNTGHAIHLSQPEATAKKILAHLDDSPYRRSKQDIARSFSRAADNYESVAILQKKVARKLVSLGPEYQGDIADLGCGTGFCAEQIATGGNTVFAMDLAQGMLRTARANRKNAARWIGGDMEQLPFASQSLDGVISSMSIQWCEELEPLFDEVRRVLKPRGWFLFSTLGPKTLCELAEAWKTVDEYIHVNKFCDHEEISRIVERQSFIVERAEKNLEQLFYHDVLGLMRDLKTIGAHNINAGQNPGLTGRQKLQRLRLAYEPFRDHSGGLPATYDVYYFLLRKP